MLIVGLLIGAMIGAPIGVILMSMIWVNPRDDWKDKP